jgi:hypothetical protein
LTSGNEDGLLENSINLKYVPPELNYLVVMVYCDFVGRIRGRGNLIL